MTLLWKEISLGNIAGFPSAGKTDIPFTVSYILIKCMSALKYRRDFSKIEESKSHYLVTYVPRKENCNKSRLLPTSERTKSPFTETKV